MEAAAEPLVNNPDPAVKAIEPNPIVLNTVAASLRDEPEGDFSIDSAPSNPSLEDKPPAASAQETEPLITVPTLPIEEENLHLETALSMIPNDAMQISFTQWNSLKRHNRVPEKTSTFPMYDRQRFIFQVLKGNQSAAIMDKKFVEVQSDL